MTRQIDPHMTVLDVVSEHEETIAVFQGYDAQAGECICCQALFESIQAVAEKYGLDLGEMLGRLEKAVGSDGCALG